MLSSRAVIGALALGGSLAVASFAHAQATGMERQPAVQAAAVQIEPRTFEIQSLEIVATRPAVRGEEARLPREVQEFWHRRWQQDQDTLARLALDGRREGTALSLRLAGERMIRFTDELGTCAGFFTCISHSLEDYIVDHGYYVVSVGHGEGGWAYLVERSSGTVTPLAAPPVMSTDRKLAFAWYPSMMDGPKLDVLHFAADGVQVEEAAVEGPCWTRLAQEGAVWRPMALDADNIGWTRDLGTGVELLADITVKRIDGSWQLVCH